MKKLLVLLLAAALLLTGCHGTQDRNTFAVPEEFDTGRNYEISFWAKNDTNLTQVAIYEQAIADFQALYPNITVNLRLYTDYGRLYNDVITNISTDTTPNVCITYPDHIATYLTGSNCVVPLDELLVHPVYGLGGSGVRFAAPARESLIPTFLAECNIGSSCYALPFMRSTEACYVNKTFVEALGYTLPETLTWDFVWEVADAATAKDAQGNYKINGQKVMIPFLYKSTDNMMIQQLRQLGAGYSTSGGSGELFHDTTQDLLETVAEHVKTGAFSTFKISSYPGDFLNAGQCIFAVDSTAGATWMGPDAPLMDISAENVVDFEIAVMTVPQFDPQKPQMISQGPSVCVFNKADPQEVLASWLFTQFLLTDDVQIAYSQTEGYVPVTASAQSNPRYQDYLSRSGEDNQLHYSVKLDATKLLLENTENTFVTPVFNGSASLRDAAGQLIENTTRSVRRKETVDDAYFAQLYKTVSSLYRLDQVRGSGFGPLPGTAVALLAGLGGTWVLLGAVSVVQWIKKKKGNKYFPTD